jgi:general secretion pathway protein B
MSSILKALKKVEQEKAARKPDSFRIDAEILRGGAQRSFFSTGACLAAIALFVCGVGATYLYMKHDQTSASVKPVQTSIKVGQPAAVVPPPESAKSASNSIPHLTTEVKSGFVKLESSKPSSRNVAIPLQLQPVKQQTGDNLRTVRPESKPLPQESRPVPPAAPPAATPPPPVLKVLGIAFQDGSANGVAVVNGVAVSKGSVIEGARVEEIQKDRVRFSRSGETFDIFLDKSN